jgi:hypothetical protein
MGFMQIRNMPDDKREAIVRAAKARGWSVAKYISTLHDLPAVYILLSGEYIHTPLTHTPNLAEPHPR